jgi:hypothetical protein
VSRCFVSLRGGVGRIFAEVKKGVEGMNNKEDRWDGPGRPHAAVGSESIWAKPVDAIIPVKTSATSIQAAVVDIAASFNFTNINELSTKTLAGHNT